MFVIVLNSPNPCTEIAGEPKYSCQTHLCFMCRKIVEHDVNLVCPSRFIHQPAEELDKLGTGMTACSPALYLPSLHIQRRIQRQRPMPVVFKSVPFGAPGR